jgi:hypothetical protein
MHAVQLRNGDKYMLAKRYNCDKRLQCFHWIRNGYPAKNCVLVHNVLSKSKVTASCVHPTVSARHPSLHLSYTGHLRRCRVAQVSTLLLTFISNLRARSIVTLISSTKCCSAVHQVINWLCDGSSVTELPANMAERVCNKVDLTPPIGRE